MRSSDAASAPGSAPLTNLKNREGQTVVKEYGDLISSFQAELTLCKNEQEALKVKLESVVSENQSLTEQLQASRNVECTKSKDVTTECLNSNLEQQLDLALQEKDSAVEMWQTGLKLITALENELQDYRNSSHIVSALSQVEEVREEYSRAISLLEEKLNAAQSRLSKERLSREDSEKQLVELQNNFKLLSEQHEKRTEELDRALVGQQAALKRLEDLEKRYREALADAKEATLSSAELESTLERSTARLEEALAREVEARDKVDEALQIVDAALAERDAALTQVAQCKEEISQLRKTLSELINEAGSQVKAEAEQIKEMYNARIKTVLVDMRRLQEENSSKTSQLQKLRADLNSMEDEVRRTKRDLEAALKDGPSLSALNRKLEGLFRAQDLAGSDAIRADLEKEQLRAEIVKLSQSHELEKRQFSLERHRLEEQIQSLQSELDGCVLTISNLSTQAEVLTATLRKKELEVESLKQALVNLDPNGATRNKCFCGGQAQVQEQLRVLERGSVLQKELQTQLDSQRKIAQKWKSEVRSITSRFQSRLRELHSEAASLRRQNRDLYNQLQSTRYQLEQCRHQVNPKIQDTYDSRVPPYEAGHELLHPQNWASSGDSLGRQS